MTAFRLMSAILRRLPVRTAFVLTHEGINQFYVHADIYQPMGISSAPLRNHPNSCVHTNERDHGARFFLASGFWEPHLTAQLSALERTGLLVDVGANYGYFSLLWLQRPGNSVIAVEPVSEYAALLRQNFASYPGRAITVEGGISDRDGKSYIDTVSDIPTMLSKLTEEATAHSRQVSTFRLETVLAENGVTEIDVLKIDAEGHDLIILNSIQSLFVQHRIKCVLWERSDAPHEKQIRALLEESGYHLILDNETVGYELE